MKMFSREKKEEKRIAIKHIHDLFNEAEKAFGKDPCLSDRYVKKARQIQMKFRIKMPGEYKRRFCKNCFKFLVPSVTSRIRINKGKVVYSCLSCKKTVRIPLKQKNK